MSPTWIWMQVAIVVFVLIAEILEGMTVGRRRQAIHDLLDLLPHWG